jgi:DNA-binding HxlR family transcriptional regulator
MRDILDRVGDRWSLLALFHLLERTQRFGELKKAIGDISSRVLTETLRHLEQDGLVSRRAHSTIPPKVEYSLTALGYSLTDTMKPMVSWAQTSRQQIVNARRDYELRVKSG